MNQLHQKKCLHISLLFSFILLASCSLTPKYQTPKLLLADTWSSNTPAIETSTTVSDLWWQAFGSDELNTLLAEGLSNNFTLEAAAHRIGQALGNAQVTGASRFPTLGINGSYIRDKDSTKNVKDWTGAASYEIDFWGKNQALFNSSNELAKATALDYQTARITLSATIVDTYFQILSLDDRIELAQKIASDSEKTLTLIQTQASLGSSSNLEVAQQRNAMQTFQSAVPTLQQQRQQALYQLAILTGRTPETFLIKQKGLASIHLPHPKTAIPSDIITHRPDIAAAEARLKSANFDIGVARAAFLPSVSLTSLLGNNVMNGNPLWNLTGTLTMPIFEGGALTGQLKVDNAHSRELVATYKETILEALVDVESQLVALDKLQQTYHIDLQAEQSAKEAANLARIRYRLGNTDFLTILTIERTLYQSQDTALQTKLLVLQSSVNLFRALGGGFNNSNTSI